MLAIDLKPSDLNPSKIVIKQVPSSCSLNRLSRLKELIRVNQENQVIFICHLMHEDVAQETLTC